VLPRPLAGMDSVPGLRGLLLSSDVVLESGSVLESDSSPYFEDSDSNFKTRSWTRGLQDLDSALYDMELMALVKKFTTQRFYALGLRLGLTD